VHAGLTSFDTVDTASRLLFTESLDRILDQEARIKSSVENLKGQSSGAIGGYHASSQILPPEDVL
jgi:adenylosuccinate lyase